MGMLEQTENIVTDDDAGLAGQLLEDAHFLRPNEQTVLCTTETVSDTVGTSSEKNSVQGRRLQNGHKASSAIKKRPRPNSNPLTGSP